MIHVNRCVISALLCGLSAVAAATAQADQDDQRSVYLQTNLVSNQPGMAQHTDPNLLNAWGIVFPPGGPFWVNSNNGGLSILYDGQGNSIAALPSVTIPLPATPRADDNSNGTAAPTGIVWNGTSSFVIPNTTLVPNFIFDSEDGTITAWNAALPHANPGPNRLAVTVIDMSHNPNDAQGAVYKGLELATNKHGNYLFAANFRAGSVDVYDAKFNPVLYRGMVVDPGNAKGTNIDGTFTDPDLPQGFAPHGIHLINGDLYVAYAKQDAPKHDDVAGAHLGLVDIFDTDGHFIRRFATGGPLNAPWGVAIAPAGFGQFAGDILVGNFGDGRINAYDRDGEFQGQLRDPDGRPVTIDGLWSLTFGGGLNSSPDTLYFSAGPNNSADGLFGTLQAQKAGDRDDDDHDVSMR